MKTILFYWSRGADTRVKLIKLMAKCEKTGSACYVNTLARKLGVSHVAVMKHLGLLIDEKYVRVLNPGGKPQFLALTAEGKKIDREFSG